MVNVNGEKVQASGQTIAEYLKNTGYNADRVVVELNLKIVSKDKYSEITLKENDAVEILNFVGGG
ncbi:MAG: sulfur carrier protein ThiS [Selenomonadaceae bacterium]|nr:sulfur carrier protein ThiS [Selenomonadaceae bacterium]